MKQEKKYDQLTVLKWSLAVSVAFAILVIVVCCDIHLPKDLFVKSEEKSVDDNSFIENVTYTYDEDVIVNGLSEDDIEKLLIPIPRGVKIENIRIENDIMRREFTVTFPKGTAEYDYSAIINHSSAVLEIQSRVDGNIVQIDVKLKILADYEFCLDKGCLYVKFVSPREKYPAIVVVDAGHGDYDVGAIQKGIYEKDINLEVVLKLKELLDHEPIKVYYTRQDDSYPSVEERVNFVNELMPDLFISVHSNYYESELVSGVSVLYNVNDSEGFGSLWLAELMTSNVSLKAQQNNRGAVKGNDIHIVRNSQVPVALVELGFMSNEKDFEKLTQKDGQALLAEGLRDGIVQALKELGKY